MYMFNIMITKYDMFNEGIRDMMTPISDKQIEELLKNKTPEDILFIGVMNGNIDFIQMAWNMGIDVNVRNEYENTPLILASFNGHIDIVEFLIKNGADLEAINNYGMTALKYAYNNSDIEMMKMLLKYGAKRNGNEKNYLNESIRDKMTPISKEKLNDVVLHKINKNKELGYFNPLDWGLTLLDYDGSGGLNDHHIVEFKSQDNRRWEMTLDERSSYPIMIREMKRGISYRVAFNYKEVEDYLRKRGLEKIVNEGVRDKMTPKPKEDIIPIIIDKILDNYSEKSVCFTNNSLSEPRIIYNQNTNIMNKVSSMFGNGIYVIVLNPTYYTDLKEFFWKRNIAFSQVMSDTYRINSHDKIKIVLAKLVEDVYNNKTDNFIIQKFTNWMR